MKIGTREDRMLDEIDAEREELLTAPGIIEDHIDPRQQEANDDTEKFMSDLLDMFSIHDHPFVIDLLSR